MWLHSLGLAKFQKDYNLCDLETRSGVTTVIAQKIAYFSLGYVYYKLRCTMNTNVIVDKLPLNHLVLHLEAFIQG